MARAKSGTALTMKFAQKYKKTYLVVDLSEEGDPESVGGWGELNNVKVLNVAGLLENELPGISLRTVQFLREVFDERKRQWY